MPGCGGSARPRPLAPPLPRIPAVGGIILNGMGTPPPGLGADRKGGPAIPARGTRPPCIMAPGGRRWRQSSAPLADVGCRFEALRNALTT